MRIKNAWRPMRVAIVGKVDSPGLVAAAARDVTLRGGIPLAPGLVGEDRAGLTAEQEQMVEKIQDQTVALAEKLLVIHPPGHSLSTSTMHRIENASWRGIRVEFFPERARGER